MSPTNHLDGQGRRLVADYLRRKKGFILVSHDRTFLDGCVDHIMALNKPPFLTYIKEIFPHGGKTLSAVKPLKRHKMSACKGK